MYNYWREQQQRKSHFQLTQLNMTNLTQLNMTNSNQPKIGHLLREHESNVKALKAICTDSIPVMYLVEWVQIYRYCTSSDTWQDCPELSPSQVNQLLTPDYRSMTMAEVKVMQDKKNRVVNNIIKFEEATSWVCWEDREPHHGRRLVVPTDAQLTNLNRLYTDLFYYDTQMDNLMTTKYRRDIERHIADISDYLEGKCDTTKYPFLNPDVYSAEKAIKIAKNEETSRRLRTNAAVSVFIEHCGQAVPELTRTTMEFVGNTGYTQYTPPTCEKWEHVPPIMTSAIGGGY